MQDAFSHSQGQVEPLHDTAHPYPTRPLRVGIRAGGCLLTNVATFIVEDVPGEPGGTGSQGDDERDVLAGLRSDAACRSKGPRNGPGEGKQQGLDRRRMEALRVTRAAVMERVNWEGLQGM